MRLVALLMTTVLVLGIGMHAAAQDAEWISTPPTFSGDDAVSPALELVSSTVRNDAVYDDFLKSKRLALFRELWTAPARSLLIMRWQLESQSDAIELSTRKPSPLTWRPEWSVSAEIGQRSAVYERAAVFVKGSNLVFVRVNSKVFGREYTLRVARAVAARL